MEAIEDNRSVMSVNLAERSLYSTLDVFIKSFLQQESKMPEVIDIINDADEVMDTWVMEVVEDNISALSVKLGDLTLDSTLDDFINSYQQQQHSDSGNHVALVGDEREDFKKEDGDIPPPPTDFEMRAVLCGDRRGSQSRCL